jgi:hypothetical protein
VTSSTSSTVAYPTIASGGIDVNGTLPITSAAVAITETTSVNAPNGITPYAVGRLAQAVRKSSDVNDTPVDYVEFTTTSTVTLNGLPALAFTLPSIMSGATYYLAVYFGGEYATYPTAGTVSGNTVTFPLGTSPGTISPTVPLVVALYAETGTPSPTPSPSPTATPTPIALVASPSALAFDQSNPGQAETVNVSYNGSALTLNAALNCSPAPAPTPTTAATPNPGYDFVASITSGPTTTAADAQVSVQGGDLFGTCVLTIDDGLGHSTTVSVETDASNVTINGKRRK